MTGVEVATIGTLAITAGDVALAAGAALSAVSAVAQSQAQASAQEFNARVALRDAQAAEAAARFDEARLRDRTQRILGAQRARTAISGVAFEGSPVEVSGTTAEETELDALAIQFTGRTRAQSARSRAAGLRFQAGQTRRAGFGSAASSILLGGARIAGAPRPAGSGVDLGIDVNSLPQGPA